MDATLRPIQSARDRVAQAAVQAASSAPSGKDKERLRDAARDFEAIFLNLMLGSMRKTVQKDSRFSGGPAEGVFQGMLDQEFATGAARKGNGLGIGEMLYRSLERAVSRQDSAAPGLDRIA